ncbi:MAG: hypothetical protein J6P73_03330 [Bacteroidales bacterium]|nr:hypothetical protein [Bacteroidales bacterium]
MKRIKLIFALSVLALGLFSCGKNSNDYLDLVGNWSVTRIDYYNTDFENKPIESTLESWEFTPGDQTDGIDMTFRSNKTGEIHDRSRVQDSTIVTTFTYSYHSDDMLLHMKTKEGGKTKRHEIQILELNTNDFNYENEYGDHYIEKAWLVRLKDNGTVAKGNTGRKAKVVRPIHEGSLLSND